MLSFSPSGSSTGNFTFRYIAVDNKGVTSNEATYTIPVEDVTISGIDIIVTHAFLTPAPYKTGDAVTVRLKVANIGTEDSWGGVIVSDIFPTNGSLTYISSKADGLSNNNDQSYDKKKGTWEPNYGNVPAGTSFYMDFTFKINSAAPILITNKVRTALDTRQTETNLLNNSTLYTISNGPAVHDVEMELDPDIPGAQPITAFSATASGGSIASFTILTLPVATTGKLYVAGVPATAGQVITPAQAEQLSFERTSAFFNGASPFTYTSTDSNGKTAKDAATYTLRITSMNPLPVTLVKFTAQMQQQQGVVLTWATAMELSNDYFAVERSTDGKTFEAIGQVKGAGNSNIRLDYSLMDGKSPAGLVYYRLKQVDFDGKSEYSRVVAVQVRGSMLEKAARLYPNPATDIAHLDLTMLPVGSYTVRIIGTDGRVVQTLTIGNEERKELGVLNLKSGRYIVQVQGQTTVQTLGLVKQ